MNVIVICFLAYNDLSGFSAQNVFSPKFEFQSKNVSDVSKNASELFLFYNVRVSIVNEMGCSNYAFNPISEISLNVKIDSLKSKMLPCHNSRAAWLKNKIVNLISEYNSDEMSDLNFTETDLPDFYQKSIRLQGNGKLVFGDGSWILMFSNSGHDDPQLGDITVAVASDGSVYFNEGHVCGGVINFITNKKIELHTASCFFLHYISDIENMRWRIFNNE